jgi:hypothetical protein
MRGNMDPLKLTLDRNCIIALEKYHKGKTRAKSGKEQNEGQKREEKNAIAIRLLNEFQNAKVISLYIPDAAMLENSPEDGEEDFSSYRDRLKRFGLEVEASSIFKAALPVSLFDKKIPPFIVLSMGNFFADASRIPCFLAMLMISLVI